MKIAMVGSWHLAVVMGACFAEKGHQVRGVDADAAAIDKLSRGEPPVFEPDLEPAIRQGLAEKRLSYTTDFAKALRGIEIVFVALDTPITESGDVDLRPIKKAVDLTAKAISRKTILVVASQVPVGTCEKLQARARELASHPVEVVCNPEFLRLGGAMPLQRKPDRVILGADSEKTAQKVAEVYAPFDSPVLTMGLREAEIVKHATNAIVAAQVSFIGEIAQVCDEYGADAMPVSKALKLDRRVGRFAYVRPGLGFNGGTVARDVKLLVGLAQKKKRTAPLLQAVLEVNQRQNTVCLDRLAKLLGKPKGKTVGILGLTYKAHTSTLRHSLTLRLAERMLEDGYRLRAFDPAIPPHDPHTGKSNVHEWDVPEDITLCETADEAADGAHALLVMVDKDEFKQLDLKKLAKHMKKKILVDPVNLYGADVAEAAGFTYIALGRGFTKR